VEKPSTESEKPILSWPMESWKWKAVAGMAWASTGGVALLSNPVNASACRYAEEGARNLGSKRWKAVAGLTKTGAMGETGGKPDAWKWGRLYGEQKTSRGSRPALGLPKAMNILIARKCTAFNKAAP